MQYASEERVREILNTQFGTDIRTVTVSGQRYSVSLENGEPIILCEWAELPEGHTVNGSNLYWVRRWEHSSGPLPEQYREVVAAL